MHYGLTNDTHMKELTQWFLTSAHQWLINGFYMACMGTVYPKKYAHGFCFAVLCCGYTLTDFPISIRLTSPALWQSIDCPSASKATLMNMDKYFMWIHYERLHNHNKAKHNKTVCIFLGYAVSASGMYRPINWRAYLFGMLWKPSESGTSLNLESISNDMDSLLFWKMVFRKLWKIQDYKFNGEIIGTYRIS